MSESQSPGQDLPAPAPRRNKRRRGQRALPLCVCGYRRREHGPGFQKGGPNDSFSPKSKAAGECMGIDTDHSYGEHIACACIEAEIAALRADVERWRSTALYHAEREKKP